MDQNHITREMNLFSSPFYYILVPLLPLLFLIVKLTRPQQSPLPPGPAPWPIIGSILHMAGLKPHITLAHLAEKHGPLISLRLGTQLLVVGSSPRAATEILKTRDRILCPRFMPQVVPVQAQDLNRMSIIWGSGATEQWKFMRALCKTGLFSTKAIEGQAQPREAKVDEMLSHLCTKKEGEIVNVGEIVFTTIFNTLSNLFSSKDFIFFEDDDGVGRGLKEVIRMMMELGTIPNLPHFYSTLRGFDLQGLKKKATKCSKQVSSVWEALIKERREKHGHGHGHEPGDFLDVMLANDFADDHINNLVIELFTAGTDTTTSSIEWAMSELLKNNEILEKVEQELNTQIKHTPKLSQLNLPYLNACIMETLRLHPPAPFLLPRRASETCEIMNYMVPKNAEIFVNVWAIGCDPKIWDQALLFKPERFLNSGLNFKGQDFEFLPFGAGRRQCPGLPMATKQIQLILASLVHFFEWSLPDHGDFSQIDMNEKFGIKEQPLLLIPKRKN